MSSLQYSVSKGPAELKRFYPYSAQISAQIDIKVLFNGRCREMNHKRAQIGFAWTFWVFKNVNSNTVLILGSQPVTMQATS